MIVLLSLPKIEVLNENADMNNTIGNFLLSKPSLNVLECYQNALSEGAYSNNQDLSAIL